MNAYKFDIFVMHSIVLENTEEDGIYTTSCDLLEIGPLKCPDVKNLNFIKTMIRDIHHTLVDIFLNMGRLLWDSQGRERIVNSFNSEKNQRQT